MRWLALLLLATPALAQPSTGPLRCPAGQFVAGFEVDGRLICEAPPKRSPHRTAPTTERLATDAQGRVLLPLKRLNALFNDPKQLSRSARVVPAMQDGAFVGFKLFGIRRSSLLASAGFKNGDIVETVAGQPIANVEQALQAYVALKTLKAGATLAVTGTRRGAPLKITLLLQ